MGNEQPHGFDQVLAEFRDTENLHHEAIGELAKIDLDALKSAYSNLSKKESKKLTPYDDVVKLIQAAQALYAVHSLYNDALQSDPFNVDKLIKYYEAYSQAFLYYQKTYSQISMGPLGLIKIPPTFDAQFKDKHSKLDFESYAIKPAQRFSRYPLLLREMNAKAASTSGAQQVEKLLPHTEQTLKELNEIPLNAAKPKAKKKNVFKKAKNVVQGFRVHQPPDIVISEPQSVPQRLTPISDSTSHSVSSNATSAPNAASDTSRVGLQLPEVELSDEARRVIELFESNNLLARTHQAQVVVTPAQQKKAAIHTDNFQTELNQMHTMTDAMGNDLRGGNRCVSTTLLVPGVPLSLFGAVGFLHDADECTVRGYMFEDSATFGVRQQAYRNVNNEKSKFEPYLDRNKFADAYRKRFEEFQQQREAYYNEIKDHLLSTGQPVDEAQIEGMVNSKFGGKEFNEVLANVYPQSVKGIVLNSDSVLDQMQAISLQAQLASQGQHLEIFYLNNGELKLYSPNPLMVANLLNDCQEVLKENAYHKMVTLKKIKKRTPDLFTEANEQELRDASKLYKMLSSSTNEKIEVLSSLAAQMGYELSTDQLSIEPISASNLRHVGYKELEFEPEPAQNARRLKGSATSKLTSAYNKLKEQEQVFISNLKARTSKNDGSDIEISDPQNVRPLQEHPSSPVVSDEARKQILLEANALIKDCIKVINQLEATKKRQGIKYSVSPSENQAIKDKKFEVLQDVMFCAQKLESDARENALTPERLQAFRAEVNTLKKANQAIDKEHRVNPSFDPVNRIVNQANSVVYRVTDWLQSKTQFKQKK